MKIKKIDTMWQYVMFTYLLFWFMVLGLGGIAIFIFDVSSFGMRYIITLCSWTPTIVLLIMLKKLKPDTSIKNFYKKVFKEKLNFSIFFIASLVIIGIFLISAKVLSIFEKTAQLQFTATALLGNILFTVIQGASGEESGWRGFLMAEVEGKYGFVKGNLILGLIWAFWHLPLWFVSTNYSGLHLLIYILSFIIGITAFSIIIGVCMKKCNNLFLSFWLHFLFNFVLTFFIGKDVYLLALLAVLYTVGAVIFTVIYLHRKRSSTISQSPHQKLIRLSIKACTM